MKGAERGRRQEKSPPEAGAEGGADERRAGADISVTYDNKALAGLNEPWSNAACMGYCLMAMQQAGVPEPMQKKVLVCLEEKFDFYSLEDAEKAGYRKTEE